MKVKDKYMTDESVQTICETVTFHACIGFVMLFLVKLFGDGKE